MSSRELQRPLEINASDQSVWQAKVSKGKVYYVQCTHMIVCRINCHIYIFLSKILIIFNKINARNYRAPNFGFCYKELVNKSFYRRNDLLEDHQYIYVGMSGVK